MSLGLSLGIGIGSNNGPPPSKGPVCDAIGRKVCVSAVYKKQQITLAPHIVFTVNGAAIVDGANPDKTNKKKLDRYAVVDLSNIQLLDRPFEPEPGFDPTGAEYGSEIICVVQVV